MAVNERRFDLTAGGAVCGNPMTTKAMRWFPSTREPGDCVAEAKGPFEIRIDERSWGRSAAGTYPP
ncbi:hypothetical protein ACPPVO_43590 [Dactylosporangium sp. McL0621]|uniref:hypothetical protein n=1 Tax=Dactylosporangium sp. McL0621 TaxID=3415678 RepID=UPI003CEBE9FE